jgi:hypothetical protein
MMLHPGAAQSGLLSVANIFTYFEFVPSDANFAVSASLSRANLGARLRLENCIRTLYACGVSRFSGSRTHIRTCRAHILCAPGLPPNTRLTDI